jgi:integrase
MAIIRMSESAKKTLEALGENNASVELWMRRVYLKKSKSDFTKFFYLRNLNLFCEYIGLTPDELIDTYKKDDGKFVEGKLDNFLSERWLSRGKIGTARNAYTAIRSFFKHSARILLKTDEPDDDSSLLDSYRLQPTEEHFKKMLDYTVSLRDRFLLVFLRETGVRVGVLEDLRLKHLRDLELAEDGSPKLLKIPLAINVYPDSKEHYITFLAKDGSELMLEYLSMRRRGRNLYHRTPKRNSQFVRETLTSESFLFIKDVDQPKGTWNQVPSSMNIQHTFRAICKKADLPPYTPHSLRRMYMNGLERGGIHPNRIEALMGHLHGLKAVYSAVGRGASLEQKIDELRLEYAKAEPYLSIAAKAPDPKKEFLNLVWARARELGITQEDLAKSPAYHLDMAPEAQYALLQGEISKRELAYLLKEAMVERLVGMEEKGESSEKVLTEMAATIDRLKQGKPSLTEDNGSSYELVDEASLLKLLNEGAISERDIIKQINGKTLIRIRRDGK